MEVTRNEMLRDVMRHAHGGGYAYQGKGALWGWLPGAEREKVLESGDYLEILRSEEFCREFWRVQLTAYAQPSSALRTGLIYRRVTDGEVNAWEVHHAVLRDHPDPLAYCYENLA